MVVSTHGIQGKTVELSLGPNALSNKTYNFDKVFSPAADQTMVFEGVVAPILDEVGSVSTLNVDVMPGLCFQGAFRVQLYSLRLWTDRDRQDIYNVGRHDGFTTPA